MLNNLRLYAFIYLYTIYMHRFALASRTGSFEAQEGSKEAEPPPGAHAPRHALGARTAEGLGFNGGQ